MMLLPTDTAVFVTCLLLGAAFCIIWFMEYLK